MSSFKKLQDDLVAAATLRNELARVEQRINEARENVPHSPSEFEEMSDIQARCDSAYQAVGWQAPAPLHGESKMLYRRRLLSNLAQKSPQWKGKEEQIQNCPSQILDMFEPQVLNDAQAEAKRPTMLSPGELRAVTRKDESGRDVTEFFGGPGAVHTAFGPFKSPARRARLNLPQYAQQMVYPRREA